MSEIPKNNNEILGYHPVTPSIKIISAGKIKEPIVKDRFQSDVDDSELDHLGDILLEVVYSHESDTYILIKGLCVFREGKQQKIKKFRCLIVGEVQLDHETIEGRLNHVLATIRTFNILEECLAIYQTLRLFEDTYTHGGKRRGKNYKKQSTIDGLCKHLPHKRSRIDILKRFGNHITSLGIEGFFYLLKAEKKQLSLSLIHNANPILRNMKMRTKINRKIKEMQNKGSDKAEIMEEIGIMIYDVFFVKTISENIEKPKATGGNDSGDDESDGGSTNHKESNEKDKSTGKGYRDIGPVDYKPIKQSFKDLVPIFSDWSNLVNSKNKLKAPETEKIHKMGENFQEAFAKFWVTFLTEGVID
ncbi:MAG: hypothetical protein JRG75_08720 [Deltaproteobacteria bacterium]|nr:hypothetical protein [Deltaproteobacteria bacterium]